MKWDFFFLICRVFRSLRFSEVRVWEFVEVVRGGLVWRDGSLEGFL